MGSQANIRSIDSLLALNAAAEQAAAGCRRMIRDAAARIANREKCETKPKEHSGARPRDKTFQNPTESDTRVRFDESNPPAHSGARNPAQPNHQKYKSNPPALSGARASTPVSERSDEPDSLRANPKTNPIKPTHNPPPHAQNP